jgi:hypothetical protein
MDRVGKNCTADAKMTDYHYCIRIIMSELVQFQRLGGIEWTLLLDKKNVPCRLQIPINCVIGDTDGHDKLLARKVDRSLGANRLCRYCDCPFGETGNPRFKIQEGNRTKCGSIRSLRNRGDRASIASLGSLAYKPMHDGLVDCHFSDK